MSDFDMEFRTKLALVLGRKVPWTGDISYVGDFGAIKKQLGNEFCSSHGRYSHLLVAVRPRQVVIKRRRRNASGSWVVVTRFSGADFHTRAIEFICATDINSPLFYFDSSNNPWDKCDG